MLFSCSTSLESLINLPSRDLVSLDQDPRCPCVGCRTNEVTTKDYMDYISLSFLTIDSDLHNSTLRRNMFPQLRWRCFEVNTALTLVRTQDNVILWSLVILIKHTDC